MERSYDSARSIGRSAQGPLAPHLDAFVSWLVEQASWTRPQPWRLLRRLLRSFVGLKIICITQMSPGSRKLQREKFLVEKPPGLTKGRNKLAIGEVAA